MHLEFETHTPRVAGRQGSNATLEPDVLTFERRGQLRIQQPVRRYQGPQEARGQEEEQRAPGSGQAQCQKQQRRERQQRQQRQRRQDRQGLQQKAAHGEGQAAL